MCPIAIHSSNFPDHSAIYLDAAHSIPGLQADSLLPLETASTSGPKRKRTKHRPDIDFPNGLTKTCFHETKFRLSPQGYVSIGGSSRRLQTNGAMIFRRIAGLADPVAETAQEKANLNHLRVPEKLDLLQRCAVIQQEPWEWQSDRLIERLADAYYQMSSTVDKFCPRILPEDQIKAQPLRLPLLQFYFEHPITPGRLPEVLENFTRGIAPLLGYYEQEKVSNPAFRREGMLRAWRVQVRKTKEYPKRKREEAFLVVYVKNQDFLRVEMSYSNPIIGEIRPENLAAPELTGLRQAIWSIACDATARLRQIQSNLHLPRIQASPRELFEALGAYGLQKATRDIGWRNLVTQVAETGCFDPGFAPPELLPGEKLVLDYRARRRIADPELGMFEHARKSAFNGPGTKFVYVLRPDWQDGPRRFLDADAASV